MIPELVRWGHRGLLEKKINIFLNGSDKPAVILTSFSSKRMRTTLSQQFYHVVRQKSSELIH